jgi:hypothetical protein
VRVSRLSFEMSDEARPSLRSRSASPDGSLLNHTANVEKPRASSKRPASVSAASKPKKARSTRGKKNPYAVEGLEEGAKASADIYLSELHVKLRAGQKNAKISQDPVSWAQRQWKPADPALGDAVTAENWKELKALKPKMQCLYCERKMSWDPSTNRMEHTCMKCPKFRRTEEWEGAECQKGVKFFEDKVAKRTNVRTCARFLCLLCAFACLCSSQYGESNSASQV